MTEGEGRLVARRYRLRRSLGRGGMGVVWLAYDESLEREVAVKEILPRGKEVRDTDPEVRRAMREARAAGKLSKHPGIVTVHDIVADEDGLPWIVMDVLRGPSLRTVLETEGPLPHEKAARICAQVLAALDYAHSEGVLHRDVKPGNVMLVGDQAVLTDFGIAVLDGVSVITATGQLPGSPEYVAPERIRGRETRPSADLWSVGVLLYGMLTGRTPFQRDDLQATMAAVLTLDPDEDPRVGPLAPVVDGLLRKNPDERMTASQAIATLTRIEALPVRLTDDEFPAVVTPPIRVAPDDSTLDPFPPPPPPRRATAPARSRRRRAVLAGAGTGVVVVVAGLVVAIVLTSQPPDATTTAPPPSTTTTTTSSIPLTLHTDTMGFEIEAPRDWQPSESNGQIIWTGPQTDPTVGPMEVRVKREPIMAPALAFLTDAETTLSGNPDYLHFHRIVLSGDDTSAVLEYTYQAVNAAAYFHEQVTAKASAGQLYTLTFTTNAKTASTLDKRWRAAQPLFAEIRDSFHLT